MVIYACKFKLGAWNYQVDLWPQQFIFLSRPHSFHLVLVNWSYSANIWGQSGISVPVNRQVGRITRSSLCGVWYHLPSFGASVGGILFYFLVGKNRKKKKKRKPCKNATKVIVYTESLLKNPSFFWFDIHWWVSCTSSIKTEKFWFSSANLHCKMWGHTASDNILSVWEPSESAWGLPLLKTGREKPIYKLS